MLPEKIVEEPESEGDNIVNQVKVKEKGAITGLPESSVEILEGVLESHGWSKRAGQVKMIEAIDKALADKRDLIVSAPVGTGKTGGYLMPAMRTKRAVICTSTKALQDQIKVELNGFVKDVKDTFGEDISWWIMKGQNNYIHHKNLARYLSECRQGRHGSEWKQYSEELEEALEECQELFARSEGKDHEILLSKLPYSITKHFVQANVTTAGADDPSMHFFSYLEASSADIVVINTALMATEVMKGDRSGILPERELIVFDEAHHANDILTDGLSKESPLNRAAKIAKSWGLTDATVAINEAIKLEDKMVDSNGDMVLTNPKVTRTDMKNEINELKKFFSGKEHSKINFDLENYAKAMTSVISVVLSSGKAKNIPENNMSTLSNGNRILIPFSIRKFRGMLERSTGEDTKTTVVMCSGTITKFDGRLIGINNSDYVVVDSPFNPKRTRFFIPSHYKYTGNLSDHGASALRTGVELVKASQGDALILTTSINRIAEYESAIRAAGFKVISSDKSKAEAIEEFKNNRGSVLIGTKSLWEGIDIPGPSLRLVVLDKIMFPIQGDPVVKTKKLYSRIVSEDDFGNNFVRPAAAMMAQGAGRLARHVDDLGGVAILDSRLINKRYGGAILNLIDSSHLVTADEASFKRFIGETKNGTIVPANSKWRPLKI